MLAIRGDQRVAGIYFPEFNRLFYHYYFRSVQEQAKRILNKKNKDRSGKQSLFLAENDGWISHTSPGA